MRASSSSPAVEASASPDSLLAAAIEAFGQRGLEGASTRDIARAAGKPMSAITYHFGGKEGLYNACAENIAASIGRQMRPALAAAQGLSRNNRDAAAARAVLKTIFDRFVATMLQTETAAFSRFIVREQMEPTPAFDILWGGVMGGLLEQIAGLLITVSDRRLSLAEARVRTVALIGQVIAFRVARATAMRLNRWKELGPAQVRAINDVVQANLAAILDQLGSPTSS